MSFALCVKEVDVRLNILSMASLACLAILTSMTFPVDAQAAAMDRYCLQGRFWGSPGNCQFATRRQCMLAASGTNSSCVLNPRYAFRKRR